MANTCLFCDFFMTARTPRVESRFGKMLRFPNSIQIARAGGKKH
jgi:hypothetical protein